MLSKGFIQQLIIIFLLHITAISKGGVLTGIITDEKNDEPLTGVTIKIIGTTFETISDFDGTYRMEGIPEGRYTVEASFVSYTNRTITGVRVKDSEDEILNIHMTKVGKWFETFAIRGYMQVRYNGLYNSNPDLTCEQCDKSWGGDPSFFIRRARLVFFGPIAPRLYYYIQPDLASSPSSGTLHFAQIRDAYFDLGLDKNNTFRLRIGQSKVPYGFENMQSSQNRIPLDRNDALNSAVANERDMGVFFYWAPTDKRQLFSDLVKTGLKGSGDYGVFALGVYNGQTANKPELNEEKHVVARFSYPFKIGNQIVEPGIQGYTGNFVLPSSQLSENVGVNADKTYLDRRIAASFILYPKPFGVMMEYTYGQGPEYNPLLDSITTQNLQGFYTTLSYMTQYRSHMITPYTRIQYYDGGKKSELDARSSIVVESETGIEWLPFPQFELTAAFTWSSRQLDDHIKIDNNQKASLIRLQGQVNF